MDEPDRIAEVYVRLALAIDRHLSGYVDAYFGPRGWREEVNASDPQPLKSLARIADQLLEQLGECSGIDATRRHFLLKQVTALRFMIHVLGGSRASMREQGQMFYDVTPRWTDEAEFHEAHRALDELLPPGKTLHERNRKHKEEVKVSIDTFRRLIQLTMNEFRRRTMERFPLPENDSVELVFVEGKPWPAFNRYLGDFTSRIEINTDLPFYVNLAVYLVSHELYPGHHTEFSIKERELYSKRGRKEHCILPLNTPAIVVSEGIAERGRRVVMSDEEWVAWHSEVLYPAAGLDHLDAGRRFLVEKASRKMDGVYGNAVLLFLESDQTSADHEVIEYFRKFRLSSKEDAQSYLRFIKSPLFHTHYLTYLHGGALVDELLKRFEDREHWFNRLLAEPVTPDLIRNWIDSGA